MNTGNIFRNASIAGAFATALAGCSADTTRGIQLDLVDAKTSESVMRIETRDRVVTCLFDPKGILQKEV